MALTILLMLSLILHFFPVMGVKYMLRCPLGDGRFQYDSELEIGAGKQAYDQCNYQSTSSCDEKKWLEDINGCSGPIPKYNTPACDMHDMCWLAPGTGHQNCDDWFKENIQTICKKRCQSTSPKCAVRCKSAGWLAHKAVRGGKSYYRNSQAEGLRICDGAKSDVIALKGEVTIGGLQKNSVKGLIRSADKPHGYMISVGKDVQEIELWVGSQKKGYKDPMLLWYGPRESKDEPISRIFGRKGKVKITEPGKYLIVLMRPDLAPKSNKYGYELRIIGIKSSLDTGWDRLVHEMYTIITFVAIGAMVGISLCCGFISSLMVLKIKEHFEVKNEQFSSVQMK